jgi:hypothetical protein
MVQVTALVQADTEQLATVQVQVQVQVMARQDLAKLDMVSVQVLDTVPQDTVQALLVMA